MEIGDIKEIFKRESKKKRERNLLVLEGLSNENWGYRCGLYDGKCNGLNRPCMFKGKEKKEIKRARNGKCKRTIKRIFMNCIKNDKKEFEEIDERYFQDSRNHIVGVEPDWLK